MRYYNEVIDQCFPTLDKETYWQVNKNVFEDDEDSDDSDEQPIVIPQKTKRKAKPDIPRTRKKRKMKIPKKQMQLQ